MVERHLDKPSALCFAGLTQGETVMRTILIAALAAVSLAQAAPVLASPSANFDRDCPNYYNQSLDPDVKAADATAFCACLADEYAAAGLDVDALDFFARTLSDDLTTFIHEYPKGDAWMEQSFKTDPVCKAEINGTSK
jgi:hypothetical protein